MEFIDFQVRAWMPDPKQAQVIVHSSPVGDMREPVAVALDRAKFDQAVQKLAERSNGASSRTDQQFVKAARQLSKVLLPPPVFSLLIRSLERIDPNEGLRVRLCLDGGLIDLPWECLYRPDAPDAGSMAGFLALDPRISLVREAPTASLKLTPSRKKQRLIFVSMVYQAENMAPGAEDEYGQLSRALMPVKDFLSEEFITAAGDGIEAALRRPAEMFHYTGATAESGGRGFLGREIGSLDGKPRLLYSDTLAILLRNAGVRLAVFSADRSGQWEFMQPLVQAGIPALIGTQGLVADVSSYVAFYEKVYSALCVGLSLDEAVIGARQHLLEVGAANKWQRYDWSAFMVYMPTMEAVLLPRPRDAGVVRRQAETRQALQRDLDRRKLRESIVKTFSFEELKILCADTQQALANDGVDMPLNLDIVGPSEGLESKVLDLIGYLDRRGYLRYLVESVRQQRPELVQGVAM